ncbi:MAG: hypothetical protein HC945_00665, partial [Nitrosarchaeum sp.]|nr:hypothetical protein [Nitrosarchaeum sp.]
EGSNQGSVTLLNGAPTQVTCVIEAQGPPRGVYQDMVDIELQYRYGQFVDQILTIQDVSLR